jgi:hypothetical protein
MLRPALRVLSALLVLAAVACTSPTAPAPTHSRLRAAAPEASFDDITPTDTTCRSGYIVTQGKTC